jgi:hypothetical protein
VYVDCASRCSCYECNENKFFLVHGYAENREQEQNEFLLPGRDYPAAFRRFSQPDKDC